VRPNATLQVNNVIYETDYSLAGSRVEVRYEPDWIGQPHRKLPLYVDGVHVGDASVRPASRQCCKAQAPRQAAVESPLEEETEQPLSRVSYIKAVKGDDD